MSPSDEIGLKHTLSLRTVLVLAPLAVMQAAEHVVRPGDSPQCYNPQSKIAMPHIYRLARERMKFTDAHAPGPLCHPSRYGLITGRFPLRTDVSKWPTHPLIREGEVTIASRLKARGYQAAMVGKWHHGFEEKGYDKPLAGGPVDHGFDSFFGMRASTDIPPYFWTP